jgi:integrase
MRQIRVRQNGNSCIIRWQYEGSQYSITWGDWFNPHDQARLDICGRLISQDCLIKEFDITLQRYKSWLIGTVPQLNGGISENANQSASGHPPLDKLLESRLQDNYNNADQSLLKLIKGFPKQIQTLDDAHEFFQSLKARKLRSTSLKRYLAVLQVLRRDLFDEFKVRTEEIPPPKPFTKEEISKILDALKNHEGYCHYHDFALFLFNTGSRISEAIGLRWQDVDLERREIHLYQSLRSDRGSTSKRVRKTTKNGKFRIVPVNQTLFKMLKSRPKDHELIFRSPKGKFIDDHTFSQRIWRKTLKLAAVPYRSPYNCRHTFVSHAVTVMEPAEVARITGHDVKVLYEHYLGTTRRSAMPELGNEDD